MKEYQSLGHLLAKAEGNEVRLEVIAGRPPQCQLTLARAPS
jgi:hypothetical protein